MGGCTSKEPVQAEKAPPPQQQKDHDQPKQSAQNSDNTKPPQQSTHTEELEGTITEPIENFYDVGREIGRGGFSVVLEGTQKKTGEKFAVKCIKKNHGCW